MRTYYDGKSFRFVNNNDIVPRVPPTYSHFGRLYQFDASGRLAAQTESLESAIEADGPPTMSEAEFDRLRATLLERRAALRSGVMTESLEAPLLEGPSLEGLFPSVSDHSLDAYVARIAAMTPA